jgi:hypothetical protein
VGKTLRDRRIYVTLAADPLVRRDQVDFRAQVTAANTDAEIDGLNDAGVRRAACAPRFYRGAFPPSDAAYARPTGTVAGSLDRSSVLDDVSSGAEGRP